MSLFLPCHKLRVSSPFDNPVGKSLQACLVLVFLLSPAPSTSKSPVSTGHPQHDEGELAPCRQPRSRTQSHLHHQPRQRRQAGEAPNTTVALVTAPSLRLLRLLRPDGGLFRGAMAAAAGRPSPSPLSPFSSRWPVSQRAPDQVASVSFKLAWHCYYPPPTPPLSFLSSPTPTGASVWLRPVLRAHSAAWAFPFSPLESIHCRHRHLSHTCTVLTEAAKERKHAPSM